jgi:hypothetical protein
MATNCSNCNNCKDECSCIPKGVTTPNYCISDTPLCPEPAPCSETFNSACIVYTGAGDTCLQISPGQSVQDVIGALIDYLSVLCDDPALTQAYTTIQDEGIDLPQQFKINFKGNGVVATNDAPNGRTNVTIPGGLVILTNAQLLNLINTNAIEVTTTYLVTDAQYADQGVLVTGAAIGQNTSVQGIGLFLNADYQDVGNYSGVTGFGTWLDIWYANYPGSVSIGDVVIWNNNHYKNLTGTYFNGLTGPNADPVNWQLLAKSTTTGYIKATDLVYYNVNTNTVNTRIDNVGNEVEFFINSKGNNSLLVFQWGKSTTTGNKVKGESICYNANNYLAFNNNTFSSGSYGDFVAYGIGVIAYNTVTGLETEFSVRFEVNGPVLSNTITNNSRMEIANIPNGATIKYNTLQEESEIYIELLTKSGLTPTDIQYNTLNNFARIRLLTGVVYTTIKYCNMSNSLIDLKGGNPGSYILNCNIHNAEIIYSNYSRTMYNKTVQQGYSNWDELLDFTDPSIWDSITGVLTLPFTYFKFVGFYNVTNWSGVPVNKIVYSPLYFPFSVNPILGQTLDVDHTAIAGAVADNMVSTSAGTVFLIGRANGGDYVEYTKSGNLLVNTKTMVIA